MAGLEGRTQLLVRLADALDDRREFFGPNGRPGNMLGKLAAHVLTATTLSNYLQIIFSRIRRHKHQAQ